MAPGGEPPDEGLSPSVATLPPFPPSGAVDVAELAALRRQFLAGAQLPPGVRPTVAESWRRSRTHGIDPDRLSPQGPDPEGLEQARARHRQLLEAAEPLLAEADQLLGPLPHLLALGGPDARILRLWVKGVPDPDLRPANLFEGARWDESAIGCNGVGTALATGEPVVLIGPEHFQAGYAGWTCMGVPLRDPDGVLVGALDLSVSNEAVSVTAWGWMLSLARWIEHALATPPTEPQEAVARILAGDPFAALRGALELLGSELELDTHRRLLGKAAREVDHARSHLEQRIADFAVALDFGREAQAMLLHEIRGALGTIANSVELVEQGEGHESRPAVDRIRRQVEVLSRLVEDLRDLEHFVRAESLRFEDLDLRDVIAEAADLMGMEMNTRGQALVAKLPSEPLPLCGDATRLQQVFVNLLSNAAKYGSPNGAAIVTAVRERDEAVVRVADEGRGIPARELERLFDLFRRVDPGKEPGSGIGLALVRRLVRLHGGRVYADSAGPGRGSVFTVRLPLAGD